MQRGASRPNALGVFCQTSCQSWALFDERLRIRSRRVRLANINWRFLTSYRLVRREAPAIVQCVDTGSVEFGYRRHGLAALFQKCAANESADDFWTRRIEYKRWMLDGVELVGELTQAFDCFIEVPSRLLGGLARNIL